MASFINQIDGTVLAVGHSYGGAIITNAVSRTTNVVGLVYVAAFAPDEGETVAGIIGRSKDSILTTAMLEYRYPTGNGDETATELIIDPTKFRDVFSADLPSESPTSTGSPSARSPPARSGNRPPRWLGRFSRPGLSWEPPTSPPGPTSCAPRPSAPTQQSSRSTDLT